MSQEKWTEQELCREGSFGSMAERAGADEIGNFS